MGLVIMPFKQAADGWVFAPMVAILGPWLGTKLGSHYVVNDTQKAELQPVLKRARYATGLVIFAVMLPSSLGHITWLQATLALSRGLRGRAGMMVVP